MWILLENPNLVRGKKYQQIVNLQNGNRFFIDIVQNQHEVETDLHVFGKWQGHDSQKMFTGADSECADFIACLAKRLNVVNIPNIDASKVRTPML